MMHATASPFPRLLGIAGGSGSGKTTLAKYVQRALGRKATVVSADWYYRDRSGLSDEARLRLNFDHPKAFETTLLRHHLDELRRRAAVRAPRYCYTSHCRFADGAAVPVAEVIIVEGLFVLHEARLRALFDLTVFVDVPADVRLTRRLRRDGAGRGIDVEETLRLYERFVRPMHERYVQPSAEHAGVVWEPLRDRQFPRRLSQQVKEMLT